MDPVVSVLIGIAAFGLAGLAIAILAVAGKRDDNDAITQEIIIRASTGPVTVNTGDNAKVIVDDADARESAPKAGDEDEDLSAKTE